MLNLLEFSLLDSTLADGLKFMSFSTYLGTDCASSINDESPCIEPLEMAYLSIFTTSVKSSAHNIGATSLFFISEACSEVNPKIPFYLILCYKSATKSNLQPIWKSYAITMYVLFLCNHNVGSFISLHVVIASIGVVRD